MYGRSQQDIIQIDHFTLGHIRRHNRTFDDIPTSAFDPVTHQCTFDDLKHPFVVVS